MSRVDEDRQAQRAAEQIALKKREEERRAQSKKTEASAFDRMMKAERPKSGEATVSKEALEDKAVMDSASAEGFEAFVRKAKDSRQGPPPRLGKPGDEPPAPETRGQQEGAGELNIKQQTKESGQSQLRDAGRREDSKKTDSTLGERSEENLNQASALGAKHARDKGELRSDNDSGGQSGQGQKDKDQKAPAEATGAASPGFRFNPALMAPVALAKPRDLAGSDRLRAIANEIAQRIVQSARVGTNAAGQAEFQIDLKSDVLKGLSIKISSKHGKIHAVFSGKDREILKALKEQAGGLREALEKRGLKLEELKFEERV